MSTPTTFFGGSTVVGGRIRKLNATTFRELVERYIHIPVQLPMTRREFFALPKEERNRRKDGPYVMACSYPFDEGHREDDTATHVNAIIIDLDEGEFVKDFAEAPETLAEHLYPFAFVAWKTANHTDENPRLKIAIGVSPCHPSLHRRFVRFFVSRLGLPDTFKGLRESLVLSQPQYRPVQFSGEEFTAVIASQPQGLLAHESDLPDPEEELSEMIDGRTYAFERGGDEDFFGLAYLPVQGLKVGDISEALEAIDPDCNYKIWTEVAAALRHQFTDEEEAREAYDKFDDWSSRGTKYRGSRDTWSKWKSFRPYAKGRAPITIRTLFKQAMDAGWDNLKVAIKIKEDVAAWMTSCTDPDVLMAEGAKRIASLPFKNDVVEEALVVLWRTAIKALSGNTIDKTTLKREIHKVRRRDADAKQDGRTESLPSWLQPICFIATQDVFHNFTTQVQLKPAAFDRNFEKELMPKEDAPPNGKPIMAPSSYALNLMDIPRVDRTIYCPLHQGSDPFFTHEGQSYLNTFDHLSVPVADPEHSARAGALFSELVFHLIAEPWLRELLLDFLASQVQFPGKLIKWLFCIQSAEGTGKGYIGKIMSMVLGAGNVRVVSPDILRSQWNDWQVGAMFHILDEIHFPGERREAVMNCLKEFITDEKIPVNQRNISARQENNWSNKIAFTNFPDALHLKESDRRWNFVRSPIQNAEQVAALNATGIFDRLAWLLTDQGAGALRYWFSKRVISPDFPYNGPAPRTKYRAAIVEESKNSMQVFIEDLIADKADPLVNDQVIHIGRLNELVGRVHRDAGHRTAVYLTQLGYERYAEGQRFRIDGSRGAIWVHSHRWLNGVPAEEFLENQLKSFGDEFEV
jgi:hypothetical protein